MSDDLDRRLNNWAEWNLRREDSGIGFPRECSYTRLQISTSGGGYMPIIESDAWLIEHAVITLGQAYPILHQVIVERYLKTRSAEQMYRACNCSERTFFRRLQDAKCIIKKTLDQLGSKPV